MELFDEMADESPRDLATVKGGGEVENEREREREREGRGTAKRPFCFKFSDMTLCRLLCCEAVLSYSLAVIEFATRLLCSKPFMQRVSV